MMVQSFSIKRERVESFFIRALLAKMKRSWEDTLDSDDDDLFNQVMDDFEGTQQGGGSRQPLFAFTLASIGPRRRWKNVVERAQFRGDLRQLREPVTGDEVGKEVFLLSFLSLKYLLF